MAESAEVAEAMEGPEGPAVAAEVHLAGEAKREGVEAGHMPVAESAAAVGGPVRLDKSSGVEVGITLQNIEGGEGVVVCRLDSNWRPRG